jgi:hypothetical protein
MTSCCPFLPKRVSNNRIRASRFSLDVQFLHPLWDLGRSVHF